MKQKKQKCVIKLIVKPVIKNCEFQVQLNYLFQSSIYKHYIASSSANHDYRSQLKYYSLKNTYYVI